MDANNFQQLKSAVTGATDIQSPTSPITQYPELAKMYQSSFQLPQIKAAVGAQSQIAATQTAAAEAAAKAEKQRHIDMVDPSKYQKIPKDDGGYKFLAPNGQEISAQDYARITDTNEATVLKDSRNPIDQSFVNDYNNLQDFLTALRNKDTTKVDAITAAQPELKNYEQNLPGLIDLFKTHYPTVYGGNKNGNQSVNDSFIPNAQVAAGNDTGIAQPGE
jgi:hypothetical protein